MTELCKRLAEEKNPELFDELVVELSLLLVAKHDRNHPEHRKPDAIDWR